MVKANKDQVNDLFAVPVSDGETIDQMTQAIARGGQRIKDQIQVAAVSCTLHAIQHGDVRKMQALDDAMNKGFHRNGFRSWCVKHGPFTYAVGGKDQAKAGYRFSAEKCEPLKAEFTADTGKLISKLMSALWYEAANEPTFDGFDLVKMIANRIKRAENIMADPVKSQHAGNRIDPVLLSKLKQLIATNGATVH